MGNLERRRLPEKEARNHSCGGTVKAIATPAASAFSLCYCSFLQNEVSKTASFAIVFTSVTVYCQQW